MYVYSYKCILICMYICKYVYLYLCIFILMYIHLTKSLIHAYNKEEGGR